VGPLEHRVSFKVYYEDTDCLGVVYYANYLRFMERGRSEFLAAHGGSVQEWNARGIAVVVHSLSMTFRRPGRLGDLLDVISTFRVDSPYKGVFGQRIECAGTVLVKAEVVVACLDADQRLIAAPDELRALGQDGGVVPGVGQAR